MLELSDKSVYIREPYNLTQQKNRIISIPTQFNSLSTLCIH